MDTIKTNFLGYFGKVSLFIPSLLLFRFRFRLHFRSSLFLSWGG